MRQASLQSQKECGQRGFPYILQCIYKAFSWKRKTERLSSRHLTSTLRVIQTLFTMKQPISLEEAETTHQECVEKTSQPLREHEDIGATIGSLITARIVTPEENGSVLRLIDLVLMPLMFIFYGLQYMDKALLGSSAQFGIIQDDVMIVRGARRRIWRTSRMLCWYSTRASFWAVSLSLQA